MRSIVAVTERMWEIDATKYWNYALVILDYVFIYHDEIYIEMLRRLKGQHIVSRYDFYANQLCYIVFAL